MSAEETQKPQDEQLVKEATSNADLESKAVMCLVGGFGAVIKETFAKPLVIMDSGNQFSDIDKATQDKLVNSAFAKCVAQNIASIFVQYPKAPQEKIYQQFFKMLMLETEGYHTAMLKMVEERAAKMLSGEPITKG